MQNWPSLVKTIHPRVLVARIKDIRRARNFPNNVNGVLGVFSSFAQASGASPRNGRLGYDTQEHSTMYDSRIGKLYIYDYAVAFWLSQILPQVKTVFDLGGHKGELYYGFSQRLDLAEIVWRVCDVPTTVREGARYARQRQCNALTFTDSPQDGDGCDLLIASGVLQYLEDDLASIVRKWQKQPRFVIVNITPMYDGEEYITLQNTQLSYNPYRVFNRTKLISSLTQLGYELHDDWRTERSLNVPFHPERYVESYQGFLLRRKDL